MTNVDPVLERIAADVAHLRERDDQYTVNRNGAELVHAAIGAGAHRRRVRVLLGWILAMLCLIAASSSLVAVYSIIQWSDRNELADALGSVGASSVEADSTDDADYTEYDSYTSCMEASETTAAGCDRWFG